MQQQGKAALLTCLYLYVAACGAEPAAPTNMQSSNRMANEGEERPTIRAYSWVAAGYSGNYRLEEGFGAEVYFYTLTSGFVVDANAKMLALLSYGPSGPGGAFNFECDGVASCSLSRGLVSNCGRFQRADYTSISSFTRHWAHGFGTSETTTRDFDSCGYLYVEEGGEGEQPAEPTWVIYQGDACEDDGGRWYEMWLDHNHDGTADEYVGDVCLLNTPNMS
jgi:hypothetical protein